jgi:hypothetical protein
MTNAQQVDAYETRAAQQRRRLHSSVEELRDVLREKLDVKANAREYIVPAAGVLAFMGLAVGYGIAGMFFPIHNRRERDSSYPHDNPSWLHME